MSNLVSLMKPASTDKCPREIALQQLLDGALPADQEVQVRTHLNHCEVCCRKIEELLAAMEGGIQGLVPAAKESISAWMSSVLQSVSEQSVRTPVTDQAVEADSEAIVFPERSADKLHGRVDEFEIIEHVASGATGHLYRAHDTKLDRIVAIKILRAELCVSNPAKQRFLREANAIARMDSDFIVKVYDVRQRSDFPPYLVMEFIDGPSLDQNLQSGTRWDRNRAVDLVCQVLEGLTAAHGKSVIHRDVKPGNILLQGQQQRAKLVDFGLARLEEQSFDLTSPGSIAGTPAYMAPEQILDAHTANEQSDVYSVGVVLYELLTGDVPFRGSVRMVLHQVLHVEPRPLRILDDEIPRDLQTICLKSMSKIPSQRYGTAAEFRDDLGRWLTGLPVLARPVGPIGRLLRWKARNPTVANLFVLIAVLVSTLVVMWGRFTLDVTAARNALKSRNKDLSESNNLLTQANKRSDAERAFAEGEANRANRQANLAFRVLNRMTFGLQNALSDRPALQQILLNGSIDDLKQLANEVTPDSAVGLTLAVAYVRLGEASLKTGNQNSAAECYRQAQRTLDAMSESLRGEADVQQCQVWLHLSRSELAQTTDSVDDACHELRKAVVLCRQIESRHPGRIATMQAHALTNVRIVASACATEQTESTVITSQADLLTEAIRLLEACVKQDNSAEDIRFDLAAARLQWARFLESTDMAKAVEETLAAVETFQTVTSDTQLAVNAVENVIEALAFLTQQKKNRLSAEAEKQLEVCRRRADDDIARLSASGLIDEQMSVKWRNQLNEQLR